jgi:uncharacterized protein Yka (UPF0111/DUF47 family)
MVQTKSTKSKKTTQKAVKETVKSKDEVREKEIPLNESTEEKIRRVGDKLSEAADRGVEVIRDVFGKVKDFSVDATELTKLKVEIHRLRSERDRLHTVIGEKLWDLRNSNKIQEIKSLFAEDFKKLEELNETIKKKEKDASKISL